MESTPPLYLVANWKQHGDVRRVRSFVHAMDHALRRMPTSIVSVFCPPSVYLAAAHAARNANSTLALGAQECSPQREGAHTGQHSAAMLREMGATYVLVGHSEVRASRGLTATDIHLSCLQAIESGVIPILCIGETRAEYEAGDTKTILTLQLAVLDGLPHAPMLIAYEPVWAIGTGLTPTGEEIAHAHRWIKHSLQEGRDRSCPVLYGGSVNPTNIREILSIAEVHGVLAGSASLHHDTWNSLCEAARARGMPTT
jgi:triosephosphate isomerase